MHSVQLHVGYASASCVHDYQHFSTAAAAAVDIDIRAERSQTPTQAGSIRARKVYKQLHRTQYVLCTLYSPITYYIDHVT